MEQLVKRVQAIILTPQTEWPVIERESGDTALLFSRYVDSNVWDALALLTFPNYAEVTRWRRVEATTPAGLAADTISLTTAIETYPVDLMRQEASDDHSYTPAWLAGIFYLIPGLSFLAVLGLYGFYLLWLGLPPLMRTPREQALIYAAAVVLCALLLVIVLGVLQVALIFGTVR